MSDSFNKMEFLPIKPTFIVFDFDGVMTDNRVIVNEYGEESVIVNRADGLGINAIRQYGIPMMILSTETNKVVVARAQKLKIPVLHGVDDKATILREYCESKNIEMNRVLYVGNDINDFEAMSLVGMKVVPSDAHICVKKIADIILNTPGGGGVVRELADLITDSIRR